MSELFVTIASSIVIAVLAIFAFKPSFKKKRNQGPPANPVHDAASEAVQETFEESVSRAGKALQTTLRCLETQGREGDRSSALLRRACQRRAT